MRMTLLFVICLICPALVCSQEKAPTGKDEKPGRQTQTAAPVTAPTAKLTLAFGLAEDTPVKLKLSRTMSSKDARADEKVDFEILEDIKVGDVVVIQHGGVAIATVTEAHPKRSMGRAGKLNINVDYVQLVDGEKAPLRAVKGGSGGSHTGAMTGAMVATGILFFPAAPLFLFMHGKDITIPKGTEVTAYIAADTPLDPARFVSKPSATASPTAHVEGPASTAPAEPSTILVKSTPDAAEILMDGKFVGSTPSTLKLSAGEHTIVLQKAGFKTWQRTLTVSSNGNVTVDATLEKLP